MAPKFSRPASAYLCQYCGTVKPQEWGRCPNCRMDETSGPCRQCGTITRLGRIERFYHREHWRDEYRRYLINTEYCRGCWARWESGDWAQDVIR